MPDYTVKDNQTGKSVTFRWDGPQPPTEADLAEVFAAARQPAPKQEESSLLGDVATGLTQSAVGTFVGLGNLVHKIPGVSTAVDALYGSTDPDPRTTAPQRSVSQQAFAEAKEAVTPRNTTQSIAKVVGDIGQVVVPGSKISALGTQLASKVPYAAGQLATRAGVEAAAGGAMAAAQGGDPGVAAVLSGAIPVAGKAARGVVNTVLGGIRHTPAEAAAVQFARANNIPLDAATATGRPIVSVIQKRVSDSLGGAGIAEAAQDAQASALTRVGGEVARKVSPNPITAEQAGGGLRTAVESVINRYARTADAAYDTLRQIEADPSSL